MLRRILVALLRGLPAAALVTVVRSVVLVRMAPDFWWRPSLVEAVLAFVGMWLITSCVCFYRMGWIASWLVAATWSVEACATVVPSGSAAYRALSVGGLFLFGVTIAVIVGRITIQARRRRMVHFEADRRAHTDIEP